MRRFFLQSAAAAGAALSVAPLHAASTAIRTKWIVRGSEGFDALSFLSPLSGDPFYLEYYKDAVAQFAPRMPAEAIATLRMLKEQAKSAKVLLSPFLDLRFSAAPDTTIDDLLASAAHPDSRILPSFRASPYWDSSDADDWQHFTAAMPPLASVLGAMKTADFSGFRRGLLKPKQGRMDELRARLVAFDPIAGAEFYTGRKFDPTIEIILLEFCKPHGIKVIGQRFLSAIDWPDDVHIRTAGHEILHPPIDKAGSRGRRPSRFSNGTGCWPGSSRSMIRSSGTTPSMDCSKRTSCPRWISSSPNASSRPEKSARAMDVSGGMHLLSAGLYGLMKQDGFARTGGNLEQWLLRRARSRPRPARPSRRGGTLLGRPVDRLWPILEPKDA